MSLEGKPGSIAHLLHLVEMGIDGILAGVEMNMQVALWVGDGPLQIRLGRAIDNREFHIGHGSYSSS